ncbi:hypothetical protein MRX96_043207 [Rhipicephalus microplus]
MVQRQGRVGGTVAETAVARLPRGVCHALATDAGQRAQSSTEQNNKEGERKIRGSTFPPSSSALRRSTAHASKGRQRARRPGEAGGRKKPINKSKRRAVRNTASPGFRERALPQLLPRASSFSFLSRPAIALDRALPPFTCCCCSSHRMDRREGGRGERAAAP